MLTNNLYLLLKDNLILSCIQIQLNYIRQNLNPLTSLIYYNINSITINLFSQNNPPTKSYSTTITYKIHIYIILIFSPQQDTPSTYSSYAGYSHCIYHINLTSSLRSIHPPKAKSIHIPLKLPPQTIKLPTPAKITLLPQQSCL